MTSTLIIFAVVFVAQTLAQSTAKNCPAFTPTDLSKIFGPANQVCTGGTCTNQCPPNRGFCRFITTSFGSSNACVDQEAICPTQPGLIAGSTVLGPADNDLNCPATLRCVSATTDNGFAGLFCVNN